VQISGELPLSRGFQEPGEKPRRFYKDVTVTAVDGGFGVMLDGRNVRGPKGGRTILPTRGLAELVAEEWAGQGEHLELAAMHANRLANTAIESVPQAREATAQQIADYAASDLLCYFAEAPAALVERQARSWGPILARAEAEEGLVLVRAAGVIHQAQPAESLARVKEIALGLGDFALTGLAFGTALFGSAVLAIALQRGWLSGAAAFDLSRLDEAWQEDQWGVDAEAAERTTRLRGEADLLERWFASLAEKA
jgi:chaperone required for assembly of F1-ATPase